MSSSPNDFHTASHVLSYPTDNCYARYGTGTPVYPQDVFASFLSHASGVGIVAPYLNSTNFAQANGKPFIMLETNTASCGGFPGLSDSFGAALWALDYGLQMAYSNFSGAMLHVGGQNQYYNVSSCALSFCVRYIDAHAVSSLSPVRSLLKAAVSMSY